MISGKQRRELESILSDLERGLTYIDKLAAFLATKARNSGALAFTRIVTAGQIEHVLGRDDPLAYPGEQSIAIVNKHIGSDFALARRARDRLGNLQVNNLT